MRRVPLFVFLLMGLALVSALGWVAGWLWRFWQAVRFMAEPFFLYGEGVRPDSAHVCLRGKLCFVFGLFFCACFNV